MTSIFKSSAHFANENMTTTPATTITNNNNNSNYNTSLKEQKHYKRIEIETNKLTYTSKFNRTRESV